MPATDKEKVADTITKLLETLNDLNAAHTNQLSESEQRRLVRTKGQVRSAINRLIVGRFKANDKAFAEALAGLRAANNEAKKAIKSVEKIEGALQSIAEATSVVVKLIG